MPKEQASFHYCSNHRHLMEQAYVLLQKQERISYRGSKRKLDLDEETLDVLKFDLVEAERIAVDENCQVFVRVGDGAPPPRPAQSRPQSQSASTYRS